MLFQLAESTTFPVALLLPVLSHKQVPKILSSRRGHEFKLGDIYKAPEGKYGEVMEKLRRKGEGEGMYLEPSSSKGCLVSKLTCIATCEILSI